VSKESFARANGVDLCYETFGDPADPAVLLVMGFTAQMTAWDQRFCADLAERGRHVIRFDNRDCGLSTKFDGQLVDMAALMAARAGGPPISEAPYSLQDMAADGIGLLDALGIGQAHIVGASMGGMIVQEMAVHYPDRVLSMTSIMSATGNPDYFESSEEAMAALLAPPPGDRDDYIDAASTWAVWSSKKYFDLGEARQRAAAAYDRSFYPEGAMRQMAAIGVSGDREPLLEKLELPVLVIHGRDDALIMASGGLRTAEVIPGAHLLLVGDMGHDIPRPLHPVVIDALISHTGLAAG